MASAVAVAAGRAKSAAPSENCAESPAITARLEAVRGRPAGARTPASRTIGHSLPPPREIGPHQTAVTFIQGAVDFAEGLCSSVQQRESAEPLGAALGGDPPSASASALRGLQSARPAEALTLHAAVAVAFAFASTAHATAQRRGSEVRTVCRRRRFPSKFTTVVFARRKVASLGWVDLRAVRERPPVSIGTLRRWNRGWVRN
jgi:hypothetical protein